LQLSSALLMPLSVIVIIIWCLRFSSADIVSFINADIFNVVILIFLAVKISRLKIKKLIMIIIIIMTLISDLCGNVFDVMMSIFGWPLNIVILKKG